MNHAHADMDDMGEWAESHPITQRAHRALPLPQRWPTRHECETYGECNDWPARRAFIPQGCDQQGRVVPTIKPADRREFAGLGQDRMHEEFDADDQSESADMEVAALLVKGLCFVLCACFAAWVVGSLYA